MVVFSAFVGYLAVMFLTGHRQVVEEGYTDPWFEVGSGDSHGAGYLSPGLKGPSAGTAMINGVGICRTAEEICHLIMNREKALGLAS